MAIKVNTNMQAIRIQQNLNSATSKMNTAMERMSSGYKINAAKDDAAGYAVSATLSKTISGSTVAQSNVAIGNDLLGTAEGTLDVIQSNLQRVRDLTEQAANGTYSEEDLKGIAAEVKARLAQVQSLASTTSFNGKKLLDGSQSNGITLQIGTEAGNTLNLSNTIFASIDMTSIAGKDGSGALANAITAGVSATTSNFLTSIDSVLNNVVNRITEIGATENRLEAVTDGLTVQKTNLTSALSTVRDADIAEESSTYVQQQILQSASATLLTQANSAPQIALTLIQG